MKKVTIRIPAGGILDGDNPEHVKALKQALLDIQYKPEPTTKMSLAKINKHIAMFERRIELLKARKAKYEVKE